MNYKINNTYLLSGAVVSALLTASSALAQNIYVANYDNGGIYDFTPGGSVNPFYSQIADAEGIAFNTSSGNLFVANSFTGAIDEITPGGSESPFATVGSASGIAINNTGDLFVTGYQTGDIYEITPTGSTSTFATGLNEPGGIAFDATGDLYIAAAGNNEIYEYKNNGGTLSTSGTPFGTGLILPGGLAFNGAGDLFATSHNVSGGDIAEITPTGNTSIYADITSPAYIAIDGAGNLYVTDNSTVTKITPGDASQSTVATGLGNATGIAIEGEALPVPEPSTWALTALGAVGFLFRRKK